MNFMKQLIQVLFGFRVEVTADLQETTYNETTFSVEVTGLLNHVRLLSMSHTYI